MWPSKGGLRVAHRARSAVGMNRGSSSAWDREIGLFWLLGGAVGGASGESLATVARAPQLAFTEARPQGVWLVLVACHSAQGVPRLVGGLEARGIFTL